MRLTRPGWWRYLPISTPMKEYCAAKRSKWNPDPSRWPGFVCDDAGTRAAGRDDRLVPRDSADDGGWHAVVAAGVPGRGRIRRNNAVRGRSANRSRTPHGSYGNFAVVEQLRQHEQDRKDDPLRCQKGLDNGNRSWQRRTIFRMAACFLGCLQRGPAVTSDRTPRIFPAGTSLTPAI
jgi:hypothetical protein